MGWKVVRAILWIVGVIVALIILFVGYLTFWAVHNVKVDMNATSTDGPSPSFSQTVDLTLLHAALKNYYDHNNDMYPASLNDLVPKFLPSIPPGTGGQPYQYHATENGRGYDLCSLKEGGQTQCLGKDSNGNTTRL